MVARWHLALHSHEDMKCVLRTQGLGDMIRLPVLRTLWELGLSTQGVGLNRKKEQGRSCGPELFRVAVNVSVTRLFFNARRVSLNHSADEPLPTGRIGNVYYW
jgi:hypothetical protein